MEDEKYLVYRVPVDTKLYKTINNYLLLEIINSENGDGPELALDFVEWLSEVGDMDNEIYTGFNFDIGRKLGADVTIMRVKRSKERSPYIFFIVIHDNINDLSLTDMKRNMYSNIEDYFGLIIDPSDIHIETIDW